MKKVSKFIVKGALCLFGIMASTECRGLSKISPTRAALGEIETAIQVYAIKHQGKFPVSLDELTQPPNDYLHKETLLDQWGEPIGYMLEGRNYVIMSSGPDKKMGTADDIITGRPESYVASWKAKQTLVVVGQETNVVQVATQTSGATSPSLLKRWFGKVSAERRGVSHTPKEDKRGVTVSPPNREGGQDNGQSKTSLWRYALIPLCLLGAVAAWRYFRKRRRE